MNKSHKLDLRVYYEDTDAGGVMYHASYLRFAERGRTELIRERGVGQARLLEEEGCVFAVTAITVEYKSPARLDDLLTVDSRVTELKGASLRMAQEIFKGDVLLATIELRLACLDKSGKAVRLPATFKDLFTITT